MYAKQERYFAYAQSFIITERKHNHPESIDVNTSLLMRYFTS